MGKRHSVSVYTLNFDMNSLITDIQNNMPKTIFFQGMVRHGAADKARRLGDRIYAEREGCHRQSLLAGPRKPQSPPTGSGIAIPIPASEFASLVDEFRAGGARRITAAPGSETS